MPRSSRGRSKVNPVSQLRRLLSVWGRMKAPVSTSSRTGSREVRLRERTKLLPDRIRSASQEVTRGVLESEAGHRPVPLHPDRNAQQELPLAVGQAPERGRVRVDAEIPGAGHVAGQVDQADRLPGEPGRVAPQMGERQRRPDRAVGGPRRSARENDCCSAQSRDRVLWKRRFDGTRLTVPDAQGAPGLARPDERGHAVHQPAQRQAEAAPAHLHVVGERHERVAALRRRILGRGVAVGVRHVERHRVQQAAGEPVGPLGAPPEGEGVGRAPALRLPQPGQRLRAEIGAGEQLRGHVGPGIGDAHRRGDAECRSGRNRSSCQRVSSAGPLVVR